MTKTEPPGRMMADPAMIRAVMEAGGAAPRPRRTRTDTRLVDPQIAPDLPGIDRAEAEDASDLADPAETDAEPAAAAAPMVTLSPAAAPRRPLRAAPPQLLPDAEEDRPVAPLTTHVTDPNRPGPPTGEAALKQLTAMDRATPDEGALLASAFAGFGALAGTLAALDEEAAALMDHTDRAVAGEARRLHRKLRDFEPTVVMIGQVKAGKTTLVNAMIGRPGLLPADVNPWTSVVTSIHLMPEMRPGPEKASFQFFDEKAWANLVQRGGRVGELASRAGANEELERVRAQLAEMRERSRQRLGRRFEMLMGQTHDYAEYGEALIERYVCLGDDFWEDTDSSRQRGRFADITRSADLWANRPEVPLPLCIRDTPGVNDTFMIREQITIGAIRGSRLCVVVLSAHQALSSVDLAMIRLISTLESRDIVIFVNRIDELDDPGPATAQIRASIEATLARHEGPAGVRIIFGSGHWAAKALAADPAGIGADSAAALMRYAADRPGPEGESAPALLWRLSGLPELCAALAERVAEGQGGEIAGQVGAGLGNLARVVAPGAATGVGMPLRLPAGRRAAEHAAALDRAVAAALSDFDVRLAGLRAGFEERVERARRAFLGRATAALLDHLERFGEDVVWSYDPVGLRTLLRSAIKVHQKGVALIGQEALEGLADEMRGLLARAHGLPDDKARVTAPPLPPAPPPLALGQTIALDLKGSWWNRFWRKTRGYAAFAERFTALIHEETTPMMEALRSDAAGRFEAEVRATLAEFARAQRALMLGDA